MSQVADQMPLYCSTSGKQWRVFHSAGAKTTESGRIYRLNLTMTATLVVMTFCFLLTLYLQRVTFLSWDSTWTVRLDLVLITADSLWLGFTVAKRWYTHWGGKLGDTHWYTGHGEQDTGTMANSKSSNKIVQVDRNTSALCEPQVEPEFLAMITLMYLSVFKCYFLHFYMTMYPVHTQEHSGLVCFFTL